MHLFSLTICIVSIAYTEQMYSPMIVTVTFVELPVESLWASCSVLFFLPRADYCIDLYPQSLVVLFLNFIYGIMYIAVSLLALYNT